MNKKVNEQFKYIKDIYVLQCTCTELFDEMQKLQEENKILIEKNNNFQNIINELYYVIKHSDLYDYRVYDEKLLSILNKED